MTAHDVSDIPSANALGAAHDALIAERLHIVGEDTKRHVVDLKKKMAAALQEVPSGGLQTVAEVAAYLGVTRGFVYEHALELGARRLGAGPKPRLRFDLAEISRTFCSAGRGSMPVEPAPVVALRRRRSRASSSVPILLPIRGQIPPSDDGAGRAAA